MRNQILSFAVAMVFISCSDSSGKTAAKRDKTPVTDSSQTSGSTGTPGSTGNSSAAGSTENLPVADAATIMKRPQVPILCYHHIIDAPKATREYDVTVEGFKAQMKILHDSGYHTILPDQLNEYLVHGTPLPEKPVMLTFDDTDLEQFTVAKPAMDQYGFKGVYFIMTISIGRPRYMTKEQIRQLSDEGHTIASHTWRHDRVDRYLTTPHMDRDMKKIVNNDWDLQLVDTRKKLEDISGKEIHYFAYPFGIWSKAGIPEIRNRGFKLAFQLSTARDADEPLYTVRRMIVAPTWSPEGMLRVMKSTFGTQK